MESDNIDTESLTILDATHLLMCKHCIGTNCMAYDMHCIPISKTKAGKIKILVFGERNWKGKDHIKNIRYVNPSKVIKKPSI